MFVDQRVGFDKQLLKTYKKNNWVRFGRELDLSPYFTKTDSPEFECKSATKRTNYVLHSVFSHEGIPLWGHYWITTYDKDSGNWIEYNDASVRIISDITLFDLSSKSNSTAYLLVYVHASERDDLVNTCRQ